MESIRVLHVDDEPEYAEMAAVYLSREDSRIEVVTETRTNDGLERLEDGAFDCVISDYEMPEMDGIAFLREVRERFSDLPFILFTGEGSEDVASEAIQAGVTHYQQKRPGTERYEMLANRIVNAVEHVRAERRARQLERINRVVREANQGLLRAETRQEIEETVCAVLADSEPYQFAWVGELQASGEVTPRAFAGDGPGYLDRITVTVDPDAPTGQGPGGRALRTGELAVLQDISSDPAFEPWRDLADERGFESVAAVPLVYEDESFGLLAVYSDRRDTFDERERDLLEDLGADIAHAIHTVELREGLERYETIVQALGDPVYALDADGNYTFVNDAFVEQTGYPREKLLGEHVSLVLDTEDVERGRERIGELLASETRTRTTYETERITADGERVLTENHIALLPSEDGTFRGTAGVHRDITERTERERELERQNERLDRLASVLSHELRNPISVADGYLGLLAEDCESQYLDSLGSAIDRMDGMVESLVTLAREGDPVESTTRVDLDSLAERCWQNVPTADATLEIGTDLAVDADEPRLCHVLENLLTNAVKHGGDGVTVRLGTLHDGRGFYVEDDGPGISDDRRELVFETGHTTSSGNTGFGLAIVAEIVEAHGWEITVTEGPMGGARFEVRGVETP